MDDIHFIHLLANPYHIKKNPVIQNNIGNELFSVIRRKYPDYTFKDYYKEDILLKLENILILKTIESTLDDIVEAVECNSSNDQFKEL